MQRNLLRQPIASPAMRRFYPPDDLLGEIQATLAAMADLECRYEMDQEQSKLGSVAEASRHAVCAEREKHHQEARRRYVQRLNELESRVQAPGGW
ncbi:hypothetical protein BB934_41330 (plasmid) [Microvirga ossetica]|uniref:Uncharacterized protein n=1 Tax=Microvirga ossetica TaxID=1882682 RepID=A0A1B2EXD2_9HYPH|nr:hypothetical protein BB934_41330 [Microvirga ossetica]